MVRIVLAILSIFAFAAEMGTTTQAAEAPRLYGLKKLAVAISTDPDGDLDRQKLRASVEAKLRSAGIRIDNGARSRLNVVIGLTMIRSDQGTGMGFAYSVHLGLTQQVYLAHNPNQLTEAMTWQTMALGTTSEKELSARCQRAVDREIDEFVSVYRNGAGE